MEINGNLVTNEFYKFDDKDDMVILNDDDYKKIIDNKNNIKIQFPYGINGIMSNIHEYSVDQFNIGNLITIINNFYNSKLLEEEKKMIYTQIEELADGLDNIHTRKDILKYTNQCFIEELEYKNGVYILRTGS